MLNILDSVIHRRFFNLLLLFLLATFGVSAQIAVASFSLLENDLTAISSGTMVMDQNGDKCALIKVETTQKGFTFNAGQLGVTKTVQQVGEIWVYVPAGVRRITISHPQLGILRDYDLGMSVQKAKTYLLKLTTGTVTTIVEESLQSQYLVFTVSPADAIVEVNQEMWPVSDGVAQKVVPFGTYDYRVEAADYHPEAGKVTVNDASTKKQVSVTLKPAFGWIEIGADGNEDLIGANVYVDKKSVGTIPVKTERLASGRHSVKVVKALYKPLEQNVLVQDNQTTQFVPQMIADFGNVTLKAENNAEIWINEERKGTGQWSGKLASGEYLFEARLANHRKTSMRKVITPQASVQTYTLQAPIPICGRLDMSSNPALAEIWLDGKKVGETPMLMPKVLIGQHEIVFKKSGYKECRKTITLTEGETQAVAVEFTQKEEVKVTPKREEVKSPQPQYSNKNTHKNKKVSVNSGTNYILGGVALSKAQPMSYCLTYGYVKRVGCYASFETNGSFDGSDFTVKEDGTPYSDVDKTVYQFDGEKRTSRMNVTGGVLVKIGQPLCLYGGLGYGSRNLMWSTTDGDWAKVKERSYQGLSYEGGVILSLGHISFSAGMVSIGTGFGEMKFGIGCNF
ncbi:MAG: PEGA domain-containing protein [Bacteroidaceae bacterium]|nr:PEGA domain-containing protein [Bacteroidaceae bacterium]